MKVIIDDLAITIPESAGNLEGFRAWMASEAFPERGRIDFMQGTIEVDMSPEDLQAHGQPKGKLYAYVLSQVGDRGQVFCDRSRLTHPAVGLSCEPDIVYVSFDALQDGRVRYDNPVPGSRKQIEIVGSANLVVEIVSDSSVRKDLRRLPRLYAEAGLEELWVLDARGTHIDFEIRHLDHRDWVVSPPDEEGFIASRVLARRLRVWRKPGPAANTWLYYVEDRPLSA